MRQRRITPVMVAGLLALLSALGLLALVSSGSIPREVSPTEHWHTVNAIARARLTQTAIQRATDQTAEVTEQAVDPMLQTATQATQTITPGS